jgi:hypothetical protein
VPAGNGELRVGRTHPRKGEDPSLLSQVVRDVNEGPSDSDRGQLSGIAYQDESVIAFDPVEQGVEGFLGQHGALVDDDCPCPASSILIGATITPNVADIAA